MYVLIANACYKEFRAKAYSLSQVLAGLLRFFVREWTGFDVGTDVDSDFVRVEHREAASVPSQLWTQHVRAGSVDGDLRGADVDSAGIGERAEGIAVYGGGGAIEEARKGGWIGGSAAPGERSELVVNRVRDVFVGYKQRKRKGNRRNDCENWVFYRGAMSLERRERKRGRV